MANIFLRTKQAFSVLRGRSAPDRPDRPYLVRASAATEIDEVGFRRIGVDGKDTNGGWVGTAIDLVDRAALVKNLRLLVRKNPFLQRSIITPLVSCLIGSGIVVKTKHKKLQKIIKEFWKCNAYTALYLEKLAGLMVTEGELIRPIAVDPQTGSIRTTYLYSDTVDIRWSENDNRLMDAIIYFQNTSGARNTENKREFVPVLAITDKDSLMAGRVKSKTAEEENEEVAKSLKAGKVGNVGGELCSYIQLNATTTRRGLPPLYSLLDFGQDLEEFVYGRLNLLRLISRYWIDVSVEGVDTDVEEIAKKYTTIPKSGTADVHNSKVTVEGKKFDLNGADTEKDLTTFLKTFDMTSLVPSEVLSGTKPIEAGSMFYKYMLSLQNGFKEALEIDIDCLIAAKKAAGLLPKGDIADLSYDIIFPEISTKDIAKLATAVNQISLALLVGVQNKWFTNDDAAAALSESMNMLLDTEIVAQTNIDAELEAEAEQLAEDENAPVEEGGEQTQPGGGSHQTTGKYNSASPNKSGNAYARFTEQGRRINKNVKNKVSRS
jgi:hypothetical protein